MINIPAAIQIHTVNIKYVCFRTKFSSFDYDNVNKNFLTTNEQLLIKEF